MYVGTDSIGVARNVEETDLFDRVSRQGYGQDQYDSRKAGGVSEETV